jgi:4-hydroxythreonine-4-phosphate dehydrogenase
MLSPIALTTGDPAGIGPEIVAKAYIQDPALMRGCFVVGDPRVVRRGACIAGRGGVVAPVCVIQSPQDADNVPLGCIPVLGIVPIEAEPPIGEVSGEAGRYAGESVIAASRLCLSNAAVAMVTAPLNKAALSMAGAPYARFPGHTEMLQAEAAAARGLRTDQLPVRMMLANQDLKVILVSIHVALRDAIAAVTMSSVLETILVADRALSRSLRLKPHIAVAGLNPHAGEGGLFGDEELTSIAPAIEAARRLGVNVVGPFAPDTVFMRARRKESRSGEFDAVVAMYHDQGLIPVKYLGLDEGVNVTLGLPYVRTSPDHGTAFDIAGKGCANPSSFLAAVRMARSLT